MGLWKHWGRNEKKMIDFYLKLVYVVTWLTFMMGHMNCDIIISLLSPLLSFDNVIYHGGIELFGAYTMQCVVNQPILVEMLYCLFLCSLLSDLLSYFIWIRSITPKNI